MAPRQSSLRAFQYIARAFEVAGFRRRSGTRRGHPPPRCYGGGWGWEALLILLLISSRPIPRADVGGSERRRKKDLRGGGADRLRSRRMRGPAGGEPYLFECVVARDKNGESLKSMWHSIATNSTSTPSSTLGRIAKLNTCVARARRPMWICVCERKRWRQWTLSRWYLWCLLIERQHQALPRAVSILAESNVLRKWSLDILKNIILYIITLIKIIFIYFLTFVVKKIGKKEKKGRILNVK